MLELLNIGDKSYECNLNSEVSSLNLNLRMRENIVVPLAAPDFNQDNSASEQVVND